MWYFFPILYLLVVTISWFDPGTITNLVPNLTMTTNKVAPSTSVAKLPTDPATVIKLHKVYLSNEPDKLSQASTLIGYEFTSLQEFDFVMTELEHTTEVSNDGLIGKFWRMMTLVNLMWLVSSVLIVVLFGPVLYQVFGPLIIHLALLLYEIGVLLYKVREELGYLTLTLMLSQSFHLYKDVGLYIAFTSVIGFYVQWMYSLSIHTESKGTELGKLLVFGVMIYPTVLLTVQYTSYLLGFMSVVLLYAYLGFSVVATGLTYYVGFKDENTMNQCIGASLVMLPLYLTFLNTGSVIKYFHYGFYVFGFVAYFLGLLIKSSRFVSKEDYGLNQIIMIVSLGSSLYTSSLFNIGALYNVAVTFFFMYGLEKFVEFDVWKNNGVVLVFCVACIFYYVSFWLNTHPTFIMDTIRG
jgi:hypothetical protein